MKRISWQQYKRGIEGYGYRFSIKRFIFTSVVMILMLILAGVAYMLHVTDIILVSVMGLFCIPFIIKYGYRNRYEARRFGDITQYMEQICASFNKNGKILSALKDVETVSQGGMKKLVNFAIEHLEKGKTTYDGSNIYEEAFEPIEIEYGCKRLVQLHRFLIKIENDGGDFKTSLNSLLRDIHSWVERTFIYQKEKSSVRVMFIIGIIISLLICSMSLFLGKYVDISENPVYRIITVIFLLLCVLSLVILEKSLSGSWLKNPVDDSYILEEYKTVVYSSPSKIRRKLLPLYLVIGLSSVALFILKLKLFSFSAILLFVLMLIFPGLRYKNAFDRTVLEIKYSFSEWIRNLTVNLQYQTVRMAIQDSYLDAPVVLKDPIKKLLLDIDENPGSPKGYFGFLEKFNIHEVSSAMKMLYSLTELGADDTSQTLDALMNRNHLLIEKTEKENAENKMIFLKQLVTVPMLFAGLKIVVDMLLFVTGFLSQMGDISEFVK